MNTILRDKIADVIRGEYTTGSENAEYFADCIIMANIVVEPLQLIADEQQLRVRIKDWVLEKFKDTEMAESISNLLFRARFLYTKYSEPKQQTRGKDTMGYCGCTVHAPECECGETCTFCKNTIRWTTENHGQIT